MGHVHHLPQNDNYIHVCVCVCVCVYLNVYFDMVLAVLLALAREKSPQGCQKQSCCYFML